MQKANKQQTAAIVNITLNKLQEYISFVQYTNNGTEDVASTTMHLNDIAYISNVLTAFVKNKNLDELSNAIYKQDSFVRDYYVNTLHAIEAVIEENYTEA